MKLKVTNTLKDHRSCTYRVQTTFPNSNRPDKSDEFADYAASAFIHLDTVTAIGKGRAGNRNMAIWTHRDMFRDSTVLEPGKYAGYVTSTMDFRLADDAFRVAKFIRDECRLLAGWEHGTNWERAYRGTIKTRVVLISSRETIHEVVEIG